MLEKIHSEKSAFSLICNLPANFRESPTVWQFHFLPLFCSENGYMGTFFHAHEFLFLSPLEYVDGIQPYFCNFRVTVLPIISGYIPLPRLFARVARSQAASSGGGQGSSLAAANRYRVEWWYLELLEII
ncbi:hypothetical protein CBG25_08320 [Arsenophonus sp. ENCA]|uniref:hypothetical protein n=1 Tax=Arsenophonus sp. ENCA TaxID=1987579 RepID=UPI000BCFF8DC|nr:hypothetical protein [Arsenophonus sp. ENCA]PAV02883.1 hypothetical protein CBG25_08320 [Arsenophonus sp. ENCA]